MICPWLKITTTVTELIPSQFGFSKEYTQTETREKFNMCEGQSCPYYVENAKGHMLQTSCLRVLFENENYHKEK